jgi:hypothetical protein
MDLTAKTTLPCDKKSVNRVCMKPAPVANHLETFFGRVLNMPNVIFLNITSAQGLLDRWVEYTSLLAENFQLYSIA